jgi:hypothetical protein
MSDASKLAVVRTTLPKETAAYLRKLADRADSGEVIAVTTVVELSDGTYRIENTGTLSRLQTIGALFEAACQRAQ